MKTFITRFRWPFSIVTVVLFAFVARVYIYGPAKGLFYRTFRTPAVLLSTFVEDFDRQQAETQREKLLSVYQSRSGSYGLRKTVSSIEGTPIGQCLVVENGRLTIVIDLTRDAYGIREFVIQYPTNVILGPITAAEEPFSSTPSRGRTVLKCYLPSGGVSYF